VVSGSYPDLFAATASAGGALTGLLFVALSLPRRQEHVSLPRVILQIRSAAAMLAFSNGLAVSLFSLVPGTHAGYPSAVLGVIGILFTAAAIRSIVSSQATRRDQVRQLELISLLLGIFGAELAAGIVAIARPHNSTPVQVIGYAVVASLLVGIARAWELVSDRNTGVLTSIAVLTGHEHGEAATASSGAAAGPAADGTGTGDARTGGTGQQAAEPGD
jgi:hypothetical protein